MQKHEVKIKIPKELIYRGEHATPIFIKTDSNSGASGEKSKFGSTTDANSGPSIL